MNLSRFSRIIDTFPSLNTHLRVWGISYILTWQLKHPGEFVGLGFMLKGVLQCQFLKLIRKKITFYLPKMEKVKVMELAFCVLNTETLAILKRKDGDQLSPIPCEGSAQASNYCCCTTDLDRLKRTSRFFPEFLNASMLQALNFKMGIITMLISYSCWRPQ